MSVLTFFCFTSLVYFALADPVPPSAVASPDSPENVQTQINAMVNDIQKSVDTHLSSLFRKLDHDDKEYIDNVIAKGIEEIINYAIFLSRDQADSNSASDARDNAVIVEFISPYGFYITGDADKPTGKGNK